MTVELPDPLVPAEVDLRDFAFMPLDVARLRDSALASEEVPEACWAAVLLWCASWHQVPAASVPDNDQWLAKVCGYVSRGKIDSAWKKVRAGALRGWVSCSDGRLYHPVVAEKAVEAWKSKLEQRYRAECGRVKKYNQRHKTTLCVPDFDSWVSAGCPRTSLPFVPEDITGMSLGTKASSPEDIPRDTASKGQGEGQGQGQGQGLSKQPLPLLPGEPVEPDTSPKPPDKPAATARGTRLAKDWQLPRAWGLWAMQEKPGWTEDRVREVAAKFADHWHAKAGRDASKVDWEATWRNWVRNEDGGQAPRNDRTAARKETLAGLTGGIVTALPTRTERTIDHEPAAVTAKAG